MYINIDIMYCCFRWIEYSNSENLVQKVTKKTSSQVYNLFIHTDSIDTENTGNHCILTPFSFLGRAAHCDAVKWAMSEYDDAGEGLVVLHGGRRDAVQAAADGEDLARGISARDRAERRAPRHVVLRRGGGVFVGAGDAIFGLG